MIWYGIYVILLFNELYHPQYHDNYWFATVLLGVIVLIGYFDARGQART